MLWLIDIQGVRRLIQSLHISVQSDSAHLMSVRRVAVAVAQGGRRVQRCALWLTDSQPGGIKLMQSLPISAEVTWCMRECALWLIDCQNGEARLTHSLKGP